MSTEIVLYAVVHYYTKGRHGGDDKWRNQYMYTYL